MNAEIRVQLYAFLSRMFLEPLDQKTLHSLKDNPSLLSELGTETLHWFDSSPLETVAKELKLDYVHLFTSGNDPVESRILDITKESTSDLQNPVMLFYYNSGFVFEVADSPVAYPDHLAIECAFMQNLVHSEKEGLQEKFLKHHIAFWAPPYLLGTKRMAQTPFYRDVCDFSAEFLISDYCFVKERMIPDS